MKGKLNLNWVLQKLVVFVDSVVSDKLPYYLEEKGQLSKSLVKKAIKAQQAREARKAREDARSGKKNKRKDTLLSGKLTPAQSKNTEKMNYI